MEDFGNRFANFYRILYVIGAIIGLAIILGGLWWSQHQRMEEIRQHLLVDCLTDCLFEKLPSGVVIDITKPKSGPDVEKCTASCHNQYGELKK